MFCPSAIALEWASGADFGCNRHCKTNPAYLEGSRGQVFEVLAGRWWVIGESGGGRGNQFKIVAQAGPVSKPLVYDVSAPRTGDIWTRSCPLASVSAPLRSDDAPYSELYSTQRSLISYFSEIGPEIVGCGGLSGPLLPGNLSKKVGGFAPHLFQWLIGRRVPFRLPKPTISGPNS